MPAASNARDRRSSRAPSSRRSGCGRRSVALALADGRGRLEARPSPASARPSARGRTSRARASSSASRPLFATVTVMAAPGQQSDRDALVDDVVFGEQDLRRPDRGRRRSTGRPSRQPAPSPAPLEHAADRVEQIGLPDRLGQVRRDAQLAAARRVAVLSRRGQHHDRRAAELRAARPSRSATAKPSRSGMLASSSTSANGLPACDAASSASSAAWPPSTAVGFMCQRVSCSSKIRRLTGVVVDDRAPAGRPAAARRRAVGAASAISNGAVKWNVLPTPGSLSSQIRPPIMLHERRRDRQPEPRAAEPARRRAVGLAERLEDRRVLVRRDADAGVADARSAASCRRRRARPRGARPARARAR